MRSKTALVLLLLLAPAALNAETPPGWYKSMDFLSQLFDPEVIFSGMEPALEKFQYVFSGIGVAILLVGTLFKVAHAQHGEQQVGWVSTFVISAALMVCGPMIGKQLFQAGDATAKWTGYDKMSSVIQAYKTLHVMLSDNSPAMDSMDSADKAKSPGDSADSKSWLAKSWDWVVSVATGLKDLVKGAFLAVKTGATYLLFTILMIIPTIALMIASLIILLGDLMRWIMFYGMNIMMPAMIAGLSFEPVRSAAKSFLIRYVAVAFWPVAWAFGNAICFTLLGIATQWVINSSVATLSTAAGGAGAGTIPVTGAAATAGVLASAAAYMSWGLIFVIVCVLTTISLLIILSAVMAPKWLTKSFTEGAAFIGSMMTTGALAGVAGTAAVATGGASLVASGGASAAALGAGRTAAGLAGHAKSAMSGMANSLQQMASRGGALGGLASLGSKVLNAGASLAGAGGNVADSAGEGVAHAMSPQGGGRIASSILNSMAGMARIGTTLGGQEGRMMAHAVDGVQKVGSGAASSAASIAGNSRVGRRLGVKGMRAMRWMQNGRSSL